MILANDQLRKNHFLDRAPASEYLVTVLDFVAADSFKTIAHEPKIQDSQGSKIIVKTHPALTVLPALDGYPFSVHHRLYGCPRNDYPYSYYPDDSYIRTQAMVCEEIKKVPAQILLFQPPVTKVNLYHHAFKVPLRCTEGVTFGMVAEELKKMNTEDTPYFRQRNRDIVEDRTKHIHTPEERKRATNALKGPRDQNWCLSLAAPCLFLEAEDAIGEET